MSGRDKDEIRRMLARRLAESANSSFYAVVSSTDEQARTCEVEAEGVRYEGVQLYAVEDASKPGFCFIPSSGSQVLVSRIGGSNELYAAMFSEVDKVLLTIGDKTGVTLEASGLTFKAGDTTLKATTGGLTLRRGGSGLKNTLKKLCEAIGRLTVTTGTGPSGIPINKAEFDEIIKDLNEYLEG